MSAQGPRWGRYHWGGKKRQRVTVGLGYLYNVLRRFNMVRLTRLLMRRPWHVADELRPDGQWVKVMAHPRRRQRATVADALNRHAAKRAQELAGTTATPPNVVPPKPVKLATIRLKPGMKLWQLVDRQVVEVSMADGRAHVNPGLPLVAALNEENAKRKLGVR